MEGEVEVTRRRKKLTTRGSREFFGEVAVVKDSPRSEP
jgi:hypothetical protein